MVLVHLYLIPLYMKKNYRSIKYIKYLCNSHINFSVGPTKKYSKYSINYKVSYLWIIKKENHLEVSLSTKLKVNIKIKLIKNRIYMRNLERYHTWLFKNFFL